MNIEANFAPYEGTKPYIFVSYSHKDSAQVVQLLNTLNKAGYRIWYDKAIHTGDDWEESIGLHLLSCTVCMPLFSRHSLKSEVCIDEIKFAKSKDKQIFPIYLEDLQGEDLPVSLFRLNSYQYLLLNNYPDMSAFMQHLEQEPKLQSCKEVEISSTLTVPDESREWSVQGEVKWFLDSTNTLTIAKASAEGRMPDFNYDAIFPFANTPWTDERENIKSVIIKSGVTNIGAYSFLGCYNISSVEIPDGVISIGRSAFNGCTSLKFVSIPASVNQIGKYVFSRCANLENIQVALANNKYSSDYGVLFDKGKQQLLCFPSGKDDGRYDIPETVTRIRRAAFSRCDSLNRITLPKRIVEIDNYAFDSCSILNSITIPHTVSRIGQGAFRCCDNLRSIEIPSSIAKIEDFCFYFCKRLSNVTFPDNIEEIGKSAFSGCENLYGVKIPKGTAYVKEGLWTSFPSQTRVQEV